MSLTISSERLTGGTGGIADVYALAPLAAAEPSPPLGPHPGPTKVVAAPPPRNALAGLRPAAQGLIPLLARALPDGYGVTIQMAAGPSPAAMRSFADAEAFIAAAPPGSIKSVIFYGHGAPGMMRIGDAGLDAGELARLLDGKLTPNARVTLYGCNTASIGSQGASNNPAETAFYGLSTLTRRIMYFSLPYFAGADRDLMETMWNDDMAIALSRALPEAQVVGFRTFAFPADRLVPGSRNATPSRRVVARTVTYLNGDEITDARRAR